MEFILSDQQIKSLCRSVIFTRGIEYFKSGRATILEQSAGNISAVVSGSDSDYHVQVQYHPANNKIVDLQCDCPYSRTTGETCKHAVSVLKKVSEENKSLVSQSEELSSAPDHLAGLFIREMLKLKPQRGKTQVKTEIYLYLTKSPYHSYIAALEFKIGTDDKMYVIRDVHKFLQALTTKTPLLFGKQLTFHPLSHTFDDKVAKLFDYFKHICDIGSASILFFGEKRRIHLNKDTYSDVFRLLKNMDIQIILGTNRMHMSIKEEMLPFEMKICKQAEYYQMSFDECAEIAPMTADCSVVMLKNSIYIVPPEQAALLQLLMQMYYKHSKTKLTFASDTKATLVADIFPRLRANVRLHVDEGVKADVHIGELALKVYLDKTQEGGISAKVLFCYGDVIFNHFAGEQASAGNKVLLRDKKGENDFIYFASDAGFYPQDGLLHISDPQVVYLFLTTHLQRLQKMAEVYSSDALLGMKVVYPAKGTGGVSLTEGNMLEFEFDFDNIPSTELADVLRAIREKKPYHRLKSGNFVDIASSNIWPIGSILENIDVSIQKLSGNKVSVPAFRAFYLDSMRSELSLNTNWRFEKYIEDYHHIEQRDYVLPEEIKGELRPYQLSGYKWLRALYDYGFGGILADEMGLGKTLQAIAFMVAVFKEKKMPALIVVPTSLLFNWQAEFEKFAPSMRVQVVYGPPAVRKEQIEALMDTCAVITSYGLLRRDAPLYSNTEFSCCIVDEAQHIKNPNTISSQAVKSIKAQGFFALTGTPLENSLAELWSIFDFIMPSYLYTRHKFRRMYEIPVIKNNDKEALGKLLTHIRPFIMRRLKSEVLSELPEKIESNMLSELEPEQKVLYAAFAASAKKEVDALLGDTDGKSSIQILSIITRLRQLCCHPALFVEDYSGSSGKLEMFIEIIEDALASGKRILVFSQFTSMLHIIGDTLTAMGLDYFYLDGTIKSTKRIEMVNAFNGGERDIFLISLRAGGTGLNLTGADTVIHYDLWWNPAVQNQATDRAHRIGQTKVVQVMKLITKGTIEERICALQDKKQAITDSVLEAGETFISSLSRDEIKALFE